VTVAVLVAALAVAGTATLTSVNLDRRSQLQQELQIMREQRAIMARQLENQQMLKQNDEALKKLLGRR